MDLGHGSGLMTEFSKIEFEELEEFEEVEANRLDDDAAEVVEE